jgi:sulfate transport system permease protein
MDTTTARRPAQTGEPARLGGWVLLGLTVLWLGALVLAPVILVLREAFGQGLDAWWQAVAEEETVHAVRLSLLVAGLAIPLNAVAGVAAAWLLARFDFAGKRALLTLLDLPLSVSPVVAGLCFVLLFGRDTPAAEWLARFDLRVLFATPGLVLATTFVTLPMVAREVLPVLQAQGADPELAAITLGADGWTLFWRVILPRARWGLLYGLVLAGARALGEFGAVSVVSGHIRGETNTLPLHVEVLHAEYRFQEAFAAASLLVVVALLALLAKKALQQHGVRKTLSH